MTVATQTLEGQLDTLIAEHRHTPGPWFFSQSANQRNNHPRQRSIGLSLEEDGSVFGYRLHPNNDDGSYLNISGFCSESDARLIAAAPDMLEALQAVTWLLADVSPDGLVKAKVDAAIAKATAS